MGFGENGGMGPADFAAMTGNNSFGGFGGDSAWWLIVLFLFMFNGNWGNGYGGGNAGGFVPYAIDSGVQRGFDQAAVMGAVQGVQGAVTTGFGDTALGLANLSQAIMQQGYQGQISTLQGFNQMASQFANCCCENRLGLANLGADIAREACSDRQAVSEAMMGLTAQNNANTNALITAMNTGFQSVKDQLCQDKIDAKNEEIANLRTQLNMRNLAESQAAQTAQLFADNTAQTQYIVNRVAPYPTPSYNVPNPFGVNCGCGTCGA